MTISQFQSGVNMLAALAVCWRSLPRGSERWWALGAAAVAGFGGVWLVIHGDPGTVTKYLSDYYLLTTSCMAAAGAGVFTTLYCWTYGMPKYWDKHTKYHWQASLALGVYFAGDVAANALYRQTEWVYDFQRMLQAGVQIWHLGVLVGVLILGLTRRVQ